MHVGEWDPTTNKKCSVPIGKKNRKAPAISKPRVSTQEKRRPSPGKMKAKKTSESSIFKLFEKCSCDASANPDESCTCVHLACNCGHDCSSLFTPAFINDMREKLWSKNLRQQNEFIMHQIGLHGNQREGDDGLKNWQPRCLL